MKMKRKTLKQTFILLKINKKEEKIGNEKPSP